jgi:hypothetical protein
MISAINFRHVRGILVVVLSTFVIQMSEVRGSVGCCVVTSDRQYCSSFSAQRTHTVQHFTLYKTVCVSSDSVKSIVRKKLKKGGK